MLPGQDGLHGTMYTGKGNGEDHIEHSSGGSALMNKRRMTGDASKKYTRLDLAKEDRIVSIVSIVNVRSNHSEEKQTSCKSSQHVQLQC